MIRLRITPEGRIRGLWTDAVNFTALGHTIVRRASHVEFDGRKQMWYVREAVPSRRLRRIVQKLTGWALGEIIAWAPSRQAALALEHELFQPGGGRWRPCTHSRRPVQAAAGPRLLPE